MFRNTKLAGVSFRTRDRRRVLVVATYACVVLYVALLWTVAQLPLPRVESFLLGLFGAVLVFVTNGVFGSLIQQQTFSERAKEALLGLGLGPRPLGAEPEPDEYETVVRNAAYYRAYKIIGWSVVALAVPAMALIQHADRYFALYAPYILLLLVLMFFSLPQAIILWEQPDLIEAESES